MEIYLLTALIFIYLITVLVGNKQLIRKIWAMAFAMSFVLMGVSLSALRLNGEDVMLNAGQFNWYYFLYVFSALTVAVGVINMWIYRRELWSLWQSPKDET